MSSAGLALFFALGVCNASAAPIISELLADNETGYRDEDGEFEDWLEIYNPDLDPVDLSGYYLTDNPTNLDKWAIPATTILESNEFLVIVASGKDRAIAGQPLHTNFSLDDAGEYLALVDPDGVTIVSEFAPAFPVQFDDASYGYEQIPVTADDVLVDVDDSCRILVPTDGTLGITWAQTSFNDDSWTAGTLGVGYERGDGYAPFINSDIEFAAFNQNASAYVRIPFTIDDLDDIIALDLEMQYDDGFAAYLNGVKVVSGNAPVTPTWNSTASSKRPDEDALDFATFSLNAHISRLQVGDNVLSIQLMNSSAGDDNLLVRPQLVATRLSSLTTGDLVYFADPTPGTRNGAQEDLPTSEVMISVPSKTFVGPFQVTLTSTFAGETIRYTTNGAVPGPNSTQYTAPINITNSTQLRARVYGANNAAGPIAMESYLRIDATLARFSSNLPIVIVDTWGRGAPDGNSHKDSFWAIIEPDPETGRARMIDDFDLATRAGLKRRGSSSFNWPKYSMTVEARNEAGLDKGVKPLGLPRESDWILSGRYQFDHALMRNDLIYELSRQTGEYATRTRFVEVIHNTGTGVLSYSGDYFGVYSLMEKIKRDDDRVAVARIDRRDSREPDVTGGYMWKKDRLDPGDSGFSVNTMGTFGWVEPKEREVTSVQRTWLTRHLNELSAALNRPDGTNTSTGKHFTDYIHQDSWLRHHWLNTLAMNVDGFRLSGYYYKHRVDTNDGKVGAGPIWDFDRTMGSTDGRDDNPSRWDGTGDSSGTWNDGRYPWWGQALSKADFRQAHTDLWQELRKTTFSRTNIEAVITDFARQIDGRDGAGDNPPGVGRTPAERNFAKWNPGRVHRSEVNILKTWLRTRTTWIDRQYTPQPLFSSTAPLVQPGLVAPGDEFAFVSGNDVYYTTDGSDPRLPGGGISSSATRVSGATAITLNDTTLITARAYDTTPLHALTRWSGPITASFLVGPLADASNFVITEVHYAPLPASTPEEIANATDPSDFEFVEMMNISATDTINLTDVHFAAGIEFTFTGSTITSLAPGERVLVVCNKTAFEARYGTGHGNRIAGEFAPTRLENAGEQLHLVDALGNTIADFRYNDKSPWPADAGVTGYSMILKSLAVPNPDYSDPTNWRSSSAIGGNPNASDSNPLVGPPLEDADGDGLRRILEHAIGTSDNDPNGTADLFSTSIQSIEVDDVANDYLTITFRRDLSADDVDLFPEMSFDFINWWSGEALVPFVAESNQGDGTSLVTYRTIIPFDPIAFPQVFLHLKASMQ